MRFQVLTSVASCVELTCNTANKLRFECENSVQFDELYKIMEARLDTLYKIIDTNYEVYTTINLDEETAIESSKILQEFDDIGIHYFNFSTDIALKAQDIILELMNAISKEDYKKIEEIKLQSTKLNTKIDEEQLKQQDYIIQIKDGKKTIVGHTKFKNCTDDEIKYISSVTLAKDSLFYSAKQAYFQAQMLLNSIYP